MKSLDLLNAHGSHAFTTNHIIAELNISPGTLYYYFRNKEEIIRELFGQIAAEFSDAYAFLRQDWQLADLVAGQRKMYTLYYKYRFFYQDIVLLLRRDETLQSLYKENQEQKWQMLQELLAAMRARSWLIAMDEKSEQALLRNIWMVTDFYYSFLLTRQKDISPKDIDAGIMQLAYLMVPYFQGQWQIELREIIEKIDHDTCTHS